MIMKIEFSRFLIQNNSIDFIAFLIDNPCRKHVVAKIGLGTFNPRVIFDYLLPFEIDTLFFDQN